MNIESGDDLDRDDMQRLVRGKDDALNQLMARHGEKLFHYLIRLTGNETDAAEIAQETFVRVYQSRDRFHINAKFSTWLYTIATNLVRNRFRWKSRHAEVSMDAESADGGAKLSDTFVANEPQPAEQIQREEQRNAVRRSVQALPEKLRTPLILAEYEDKSMQEIAEILECSAKAVEGRLARAREELRGSLQKLMERS